METVAEGLRISGRIVHFLHQNEEFSVAKFQSDGGPLFAITGYLHGTGKGETIIVYGDWSVHPKHGKQFAVVRWERPVPKTTEQIKAYLTSKYVKGCGKKRAELIVQHLGEQALDRLMNEGTFCLWGIKEIGEQQAQQIVESVRSSFEIQNVMMALLPYNISPVTISKIHQKFGPDCLEFVQRNPYRLIEVEQIGFQKADEIAMNVGVDSQSPYRLNACLLFVLMKQCYENGHCYVPEDELVELTLAELNRNGKTVVSEAVVRDELNLMAAHEQVMWEDGAVYPKHLYVYETMLAHKLACLASRNGGAMPSGVETIIRQYQTQQGIVLAEKQREAIRELFRRHLLVVTGNPGTGKTTVIKAMIEAYQKQYPKKRIGLCAPTGRASRKLAELTGLDAETIHMTLGFRPGEEPEFGEGMPLPVDLLFADEWSMTDLQLSHYLFQAISNRTKVVIIGDTDQLPSVGPGNVLHDMLAAGVPHVRLDEIFRQAQDSQIIMNAHRINKGQMIQIDPNKEDFFFIEEELPERIAVWIEKSVLRLLKKGYSVEDILVLSPMKQGPIGTLEINRRLQVVINPPAPDKEEWVMKDRVFRQGDRVIRERKNDYQKKVLNGDMGTVVGIRVLLDEKGNPTEEKGLVCNFYGREVIFVKEELRYLNLGYAATVHKAQGGQAKAVIMPVSTAHNVMLQRNLFYTGMTRPERMFVGIGTRRALATAIRNNKITKRNTRLRERIEKEMAQIPAVASRTGEGR